MNDIELAQKYINKRNNALSRGIKFTMTLQSMRNLMGAKKCYYTGVPLTNPSAGYAKASDRTIDRIDPSKGYEPGNVVACCHAANQLKAQVEQGGIPGLQMGIRILEKAIKRTDK